MDDLQWILWFPVVKTDWVITFVEHRMVFCIIFFLDSVNISTKRLPIQPLVSKENIQWNIHWKQQALCVRMCVCARVHVCMLIWCSLHQIALTGLQLVLSQLTLEKNNYMWTSYQPLVKHSEVVNKCVNLKKNYLRKQGFASQFWVGTIIHHQDR